MANLSVAALFAGIGGLEAGLHQHGFEPHLFCEIDGGAQAVLRAQFPDVPLWDDICSLKSLPTVDVVTAGFPCQDLSQAGGKRGIKGSRSGLVGHLLRLLTKARRKPELVLIENVSYMLRLANGRAMRFLTSELAGLGYRWAYRVVDARSFGVPQRRLRVLLVASRGDVDPRDVLLADDVVDSRVVTHRLQAPLVVDSFGPDRVEITPGRSYGFYWTEGRIGIGWTTDAVPPIKGGSGLGIPSPPAVWVPSTNQLGVPTLADGERLQGLPSGWTAPASDGRRAQGARWKLLGNAVCAPMTGWLGSRIVAPSVYRDSDPKETPFLGGTWPNAAFGSSSGDMVAVHRSVWPLRPRPKSLVRFLNDELVPLSERAAAGFLDRVRRTEKINYAPAFVRGLEAYVGAFKN